MNANPTTPPSPRPAPIPLTRVQRALRFAAGFLAWFIASTPAWMLLGGADLRRLYPLSPDAAFLFFVLVYAIVYPLNLSAGAILATSPRTRSIAEGQAAAIVANIIVAVLLGRRLHALGLIPFFIW